MSLKVYVAGAWVEQHQRARPMIAKLREAGIEITCDWTQAEGDVCSCGHHRQAHRPYATEGTWLGATPSQDRRAGFDIETVPATGCAVDIGITVSYSQRCPCDAFNGIGVGGDSVLTDEARKKYALADLRGVLDADVVWLLAANDKGACGSWVELGAALTARALRSEALRPLQGPLVVVSGPKNKRTIFTELADRLLDTDGEALVEVLAMAAMKAAGEKATP